MKYTFIPLILLVSLILTACEPRPPSDLSKLSPTSEIKAPPGHLDAINLNPNLNDDVFFVTQARMTPENTEIVSSISGNVSLNDISPPGTQYHFDYLEKAFSGDLVGHTDGSFTYTAKKYLDPKGVTFGYQLVLYYTGEKIDQPHPCFKKVGTNHLVNLRCKFVFLNVAVPKMFTQENYTETWLDATNQSKLNFYVNAGNENYPDTSTLATHTQSRYADATFNPRTGLLTYTPKKISPSSDYNDYYS